MKHWIRIGLSFAYCVALCTGGRADDANPIVVDGPSRGQLFEARMRADMGPAYNPVTSPAAPIFYLPSDLKDVVLGIDVSHHNDENCTCKAGETCSECKIDWSKISSQNVNFVYVKESQGSRYRDPTFEHHWRALATFKIPRGAYHSLAADEDPVAQADNFVDRLDDLGKLQPLDLPPCLDLESDLRKDAAKRWIVTPDNGKIRDFWAGQDPDDVLQKALQWLKRVEERTGRRPIVYTSRGWWRAIIKDDAKIAKLQGYPIWIANYTDSGNPVHGKPKVPNDSTWTLWHFTDSGRMADADVLPGKLNVTIFNGAPTDFQKALGITPPEKVAVARLDPSKAKQPEQATDAIPTEMKEAAKPADQVAIVSPSETKEPAKPADQVATVAPAETKEPAKPADQVATVAPSETKEPAKPVDQTAIVTPAETKEAKPADQVATVTPSDSTDSPKPVDQTATAAPTETKPSATAASAAPTTRASRSSRARARSPAPQLAEVKSPSDKVASDTSPTNGSPVEIVLANGRVLRVDATIDPDVLSRLISAIDGN